MYTSVYVLSEVSSDAVLCLLFTTLSRDSLDHCIIRWTGHLFKTIVPDKFVSHLSFFFSFLDHDYKVI